MQTDSNISKLAPRGDCHSSLAVGFAFAAGGFTHIETMTTPSYFAATRSLDLTTKPGAMPMARIVEMLDAINCVSVCCCHAFGGPEHMPAHYAKRADKIARSTQLSFAKVRRVLVLWQKWTRQFHGEQVPDVSAVQSFLWELDAINL